MNGLTESTLTSGVYDIFKNVFSYIKRKIVIRELIREAAKQSTLGLDPSTELYSRLEAVFSDEGLSAVISQVSNANGYRFIDLLRVEMKRITRELGYLDDDEVSTFISRFITLLQEKIKAEVPELYSQILLLEIKEEHVQHWGTIQKSTNEMMKKLHVVMNNQERILKNQEELRDNLEPVKSPAKENPGNAYYKSELFHWENSFLHLKAPYNSKDFDIMENFESYLYLFSLMAHINNAPIGGNIFDRMYDIIVSSTSVYALSIRGEYGVGKTTLLSLYYWHQHGKWCKNNNDFFPIFINLNNYYSYIYNDSQSEDIEKQAIERVNEEMKKMSEYVKKMPISKVLFLVDGDDGFAIKRACLNTIVHYINTEVIANREGKRIQIKKIAGHSVSKYWKYVQAEDYQNIIEIRGIKIDSVQAEQYIREFTKISSFRTEQSVVEKVLVDINELYDITLDFFTLYIIFYTYKNNGGNITYENIIKKFCILFINNRGVTNKPDETVLFEASELAFRHFIEKIKMEKDTLLGKKDYWELIHFHPTVSAFLIAYYIFHTLQEDMNLEKNNNVLNYIYPNSVNKFCKKMIDENTRVQDNIIALANKLIDVPKDKELCYSGANISYYLGRINHTRVKTDEILKKLVKKLNNIPDGGDITEIRKRLFMLRSVYVSLIYKKDAYELANYIKNMIESKESLRLNINFFSIYYEEVSYDTENFFEDLGREIYNCENTFNKLYSKIDSELGDIKHGNAVFQFNLFTLISIYTISVDIPWKKTKREEIKRILQKVISQKNKLVPILQDFIEWVESYIRSETFSGLGLIKELYDLKTLHRNGWVRRNVKSEIETVASHMYLCALNSMMLLKESQEYSKDKIIKMLLIHDLAETFTGDKATPDKKTDDVDMEKKWMRHISMYNVLSTYHDLGDWDELFEEYEEKKTLESKIAQDFDKLDAFMQLCRYKIDKCETIEDFEKWKDEIRSNLLTEIGRTVYNYIDDLFISEDSSNVFVYILESYKYEAVMRVIEQNKYFFVAKDYCSDIASIKDKIRNIVLCKKDENGITVQYIFDCRYAELGSKGDYKFLYNDSSPVHKTIARDELECSKDRLMSLNELYCLIGNRQ